MGPSPRFIKCGAYLCCLRCNSTRYIGPGLNVCTTKATCIQSKTKRNVAIPQPGLWSEGTGQRSSDACLPSACEFQDKADLRLEAA